MTSAKNEGIGALVRQEGTAKFLGTHNRSLNKPKEGAQVNFGKVISPEGLAAGQGILLHYVGIKGVHIIIQKVLPIRDVHI